MTGCERGRRIALLTPYTGGNLGDAAIQDAMVANLRARMSDVKIAGISLNCENFVERHGAEAFPLCGRDRPFYGMSYGSMEQHRLGERQTGNETAGRQEVNRGPKWWVRERMPTLWRYLRTVYSSAGGPWKEIRHWLKGYQFLRTQDLLIVSGGGQLDEEWGGPWGHPYALFKWAVLARIARVPFAVASVGACKITSTFSRLFLSAALSLAQYRSYRDMNSKKAAARLLRRAVLDPVIPDIAFSLPSAEVPPPAGIRSISQGRRVVAISPIAYAKPRIWVCEDSALYERYLQEMARVMSQLLQCEYFLVFVWSGLGEDDRVVHEIMGLLDDESKQRAARQMYIPVIRNWKDLVALLQDADLLIASRLHSTILGFVTQTPTVAISFDPKVDWVMEDLGMTEYLLQIGDFSAKHVIHALDQLMLRRDSVLEKIASYRDATPSIFARQYDALVGLALQQHC